MYPIIRKFLFFFDPEKVHYFTMNSLSFLLKIGLIRRVFRAQFILDNNELKTHVFGLDFKNPVGLAAGFDKNARYIDELSYCGFGFIEIGTLTPKGQEGNPKKRLFRLKNDHGIINRMGFNNDGVKIAVKHLKKMRSNGVLVGGNIGKNKITPNDQADNDYLLCFDALFDYVDYFVVNVSSPNTPNLRALQEKEPLQRLLGLLVTENKSRDKSKPILLKIAPDLSNEQLDDIIEIVLKTEIDGLIATNTTISRENLLSSKETIENIGNGGLSGKPLANRSTDVIRYISKESDGRIPIIGVGGIHSAKDALDKIDAGAALVQLYTGFIYEGPGLIKEINNGILKRRMDE
jgi:dihydroorotate dehydrogenase